MSLKVFIIAGEASGDKLGAALMRGLMSLRKVEFEGVGGDLMQAEGLRSRFPMSELSLMGLVEILPKYRELKARIRETANAILAQKPDVLITIDSPDFCLRVAKQVKAASNIRTVHYVAPTVWAWRSGRAEKMSAYIDHVLALFPFEPPLIETAGMTCDFVGHPVVAEPIASEADAEAYRSELKSDGPLILALPGSRKGEVNRLSDRFGATLIHVIEVHPNAKVVVPCARPVFDLVKRRTAQWPGNVTLIHPEDTDQKRAAFRAADVALAASGTVSLELAAVSTPMVIAYDMAWLSRIIISRMLKVETVTLVNLVSETRAVPEYIGTDCQPREIAEGILDVLADPNQQADAMTVTLDRLGRGQADPGLKAAQSILNAL